MQNLIAGALQVKERQKSIVFNRKVCDHKNLVLALTVCTPNVCSTRPGNVSRLGPSAYLIRLLPNSFQTKANDRGALPVAFVDVDVVLA